MTRRYIFIKPEVAQSPQTNQSQYDPQGTIFIRVHSVHAVDRIRLGVRCAKTTATTLSFCEKIEMICGVHFEFQQNLKKSDAHLHIVGNVIVKFE